MDARSLQTSWLHNNKSGIRIVGVPPNRFLPTINSHNIIRHNKVKNETIMLGLKKYPSRKWGSQLNNQSMEYILNSGPYPLFRKALLKAKNQTCLVLGAGHEVAIVNEYSKKVIGVNISKIALKKIRNSNVDLILGDGQKLPIKNSCISMVICKSVLNHFSDIPASLLEMNRIAIQHAYLYFHEPGLLNIVAYFGRKFFPTEIHDPSENPFIPSNIRKTIGYYFDIINETDFFIFIHALPILERLLNLKSPLTFLNLLIGFDKLLSRTYLKNFS